MTTVAAGRYALLFDGSTVEIRAARPADARAVRQMHELMSPDNVYLRFFSLSPQAPDREAKRLCRPDGPDHAALLARLDGRLVGVASYEQTNQPGVAEIAFAVPDEIRTEEVYAIVCVRPGHELVPEQLWLWCRERLAAFKVPRFWQPADDLPRTDSERVAKRRLGEVRGPVFDTAAGEWSAA